jgi:hypothetical protein
MTVARLRQELTSREFETWRIYWAIQRQQQELAMEKARG